MFKAIVIENVERQLKLIKSITHDSFPQIDFVHELKDLKNAVKVISEKKPDLLIVNNRYSKGMVLNMLEKLSPCFFEIIICSKDINEVNKFMKFNIVDFIKNPMTELDLKAALNKSIIVLTNKYINQQKDLLLMTTKSLYLEKLNRIAIPTIEGYVFVDAQKIIRFEANGTYTTIYTDSKEKIVASKNIKEFEDTLSKIDFFRIHNSHIVNVNRIVKYNKGRGGTITMDDGSQIEVATRRKIEFLNIFQ